MRLRCGVVEGEWLPDTACAMAHRLARGASREAADGSPVAHTLPYLERVGHAMGQAMLDERVEIEEALTAEMEIPQAARA